MERKLFKKIVHDFFPMGSQQEGASLELVDDIEVGDDEVRITLRLIVWNTDGAQPTLLDVKEQTLCAARREHLEDLGRYRAFLKSVRREFSQLSRDQILHTMPWDLFELELLDTTDAGTLEEFKSVQNPPTIEPMCHFGGGPRYSKIQLPG